MSSVYVNFHPTSLVCNQRSYILFWLVLLLCIVTKLLIGWACIYPSIDVVLVSVVSTTSTSVTISWTLNDSVTATSDYTICYSNTNNQCFNDSKDITGITATEKTLTGLQEGTHYSITVTVMLSNGETGGTITATTMAAG